MDTSPVFSYPLKNAENTENFQPQGKEPVQVNGPRPRS